ncbi:MAG: NAD(P)H-dependent oxidoreductase subunit E [Chloroflexi bacterium]|nr:NAD(P)H-dependent oxidoreductase subunit E [Chloroflexota bacterium]
MASVKDRINKALNQQVKEEVTVLSSLIQVQEELGYLPPESISAIADFTGASVNEAYGVATFYTHFRFSPPGEHTIEICWGSSCHLQGASDIIQAVKEELQMEEEGTTSDSKFSWKRSSCAAACAHGPVMLIDDKIYGRLSPERAINLIKEANGHKG